MSVDRNNFSSTEADSFDVAVSEWVHRELEPHTGRARAALRQVVADEQVMRPPTRHRSWPWTIGVLAAAAVAAAAGFWMTGEGDSGGQIGPTVATQTPGSATHERRPVSSASQPSLLTADWSMGVSNVAHQEVWRSTDAGTVVIAGQPARAVRRERWQSMQFDDPAGYQVQISVPQHDLVFVALPDE